MPRASTTIPLHQALEAAFAKLPFLAKRVQTKRVNIVSTKLCDDVLKRLAPSLKAHHQCDIIDLNPGPGLLSSKIHKLLKPRTHILLEPDREVYHPFLAPLLNQHGSRYHLAPQEVFKEGEFWYEDGAEYSRGLLTNQQNGTSGEPDPDKLNTSVLLLANLARYPPKRAMGYYSTTNLIMHQLISSIRNHKAFQAHGLVRILAWMVDSEKQCLLPTTIAERFKYPFQAEISTDIQEIAGSQDPSGQRRREEEINQASAARVASLAKKSDIEPSHGAGDRLQEVAEVGETKSEGISSRSEAKKNKTWHEELADLEKRWDQGLFTEFAGNVPSPKKGDGRRANDKRTPEYLRMKILQQSIRRDSIRQGHVEKLLDEQAGLESLRSSIATSTMSPEEKREQEARLEKATEQFRDNLSKSSYLTQQAFAHIWDDRSAFQREEPLLMWDRRREEPIEVQSEDFFPTQKLTLLDLQPKPLPSSLRKSPEIYALFDYMVNNLFIQPGQSVASGLNQLAPGAAEALIPNVPALTDPQRGGRAEIEQLRVRMLTLEMFEGLALAWDKWLFKPDMGQLIMRMGNAPPLLERSGHKGRPGI